MLLLPELFGPNMRVIGARRILTGDEKHLKFSSSIERSLTVLAFSNGVPLIRGGVKQTPVLSVSDSLDSTIVV